MGGRHLLLNHGGRQANGGLHDLDACPTSWRRRRDARACSTPGAEARRRRPKRSRSGPPAVGSDGPTRTHSPSAATDAVVAQLRAVLAEARPDQWPSTAIGASRILRAACCDRRRQLFGSSLERTTKIATMDEAVQRTGKAFARRRPVRSESRKFKWASGFHLTGPKVSRHGASQVAPQRVVQIRERPGLASPRVSVMGCATRCVRHHRRGLSVGAVIVG